MPRAERHARSARLLALSEEKRRAFYAHNVGQVRPVLWEHARPGRPQHGFTDNYVRVELPAGACAPDNAIARVRLGGPTADGEALMALTDE